MTADPPPPPRRCHACRGGLYAAVPFCPFCGAEQPRPARAPPVRIPPPAEPPAAPPKTVQAPAPRSASPAPMIAAARAPPATPPPRSERPPRRVGSPIRRFGPRQAVLAAAAIAALSALALHMGEEAPTRIRVGPAWTAVALGPFRAAPLLRLTGEAAFSLRLDGERVLRVERDGGATVRPKELRSLELRSGRGELIVTLTPRGR